MFTPMIVPARGRSHSTASWFLTDRKRSPHKWDPVESLGGSLLMVESWQQNRRFPDFASAELPIDDLTRGPSGLPIGQFSAIPSAEIVS